MPRYFIEVSYKGTRYAGFQVQKNANTVQAEVEAALQVYFRRPFVLTGSSRTDAGVHALQNYFHCDSLEIVDCERSAYHLNCILPADIVIKSLTAVGDGAHCRFDAASRTYVYTIYQQKDPFLQDTAYYYPYELDLTSLQAAADIIVGAHNFKSFSKKNVQSKTFDCIILASTWELADGKFIYKVTGDRFLRGMVRGLVGTMLRVGRRQMAIGVFRDLLEKRDASLTDFSTPAKGLILRSVAFT